MPRPKGARDATYPEKSGALLQRMLARVMRRETARPSLRQMAQAAGVAVPTLRHYFGDRPQVMEAMLAAYHEAGKPRLEKVAEPEGDFPTSVRAYARALREAVRAERDVRLGDVFAVSLAEGLLDPQIGPAALRHVIDPSLEALQGRLDVHVARGEMIAADTRTAALMLLSPLLLAILHQDYMGGATCNPVEMDAVIDEVCGAFLRAYAAGRTDAT